MYSLAALDMMILFFIMGALASWIRSDLEFSPSISKFLSIFLLLSLGLKGGHEVRIAEDSSALSLTIGLGLLSCLAIPCLLFYIFRRRLGPENAAAVSACYGSVSAITLITAQNILRNIELSYSGYMVAVMAIMEIPAIMLSLFFYRRSIGLKDEKNVTHFAAMFSTKSVILLLGGFIIGFLMNESTWGSLTPVIQDCFKGALAFFLLDLGILAQKQLRDAWRFKCTAFIISCVLPLIFGSIALYFSHKLALPQGDQILLAVLVGSASYIAAPAAIRANIPGANPSLYIALPLAITFPMNVVLGIPYYIQLSYWLMKAS